MIKKQTLTSYTVTVKSTEKKARKKWIPCNLM